MTKTMSALLALGLLGSVAVAEDAAPPPPKKPETPLKLQVVLSRYQGEKKVANLPYTLSLIANGEPTELKVSIQVPLKFEGRDFPGNTVYKDVGTRLQCKAESREDGRFRVMCSIEQGSVFAANGERAALDAPGGQAAPHPPVLKVFHSETTLILGDGQSGQHVAATDPMNGEVYRVELTLNALK